MDICLFNKFGHCKFQSKCRKRHIKKKCEKENCEIQNCLERHPRECSYFRDFGRCKFGSYCSFDHKASKDDTIIKLEKDLNDVKNRLDEIEEVLKSKNKQIEFILAALEDKTDHNKECNFLINDLETMTVHQEKPSESSYEQVENTMENNLFKCDVCDYESSSKKGVSIHKGSKHKDVNGLDKQISKPVIEKVEKLSVSPHPKFKCYHCGESLPTISDLINHHNLNHKGYPKKMVCDNCDQICTNIPMLNNHKETEHNMYICARCNTQFYGRENLDEHTRKQHT